MVVKCEYSKNELDIISTFRLLWQQHVGWMRMFIISNAANLPDTSYTLKRLLRNAAAFADEIKKYYGKEKAKIFQELITRHLLVGEILVKNLQEADAYRRKWYENADDIAEFLANINPYYNEHEWRAMLYDNLYMTENQALYRLKDDYEDDISEFDSILSQALRIADMMSEGIIKQFK